MEEEMNKTEFNSNVSSLIRIDKLMQDCHLARINRELFKWFLFLEGLMVECRYTADSKIKSNIDDKYRWLKSNIKLINTQQSNNSLILTDVFDKLLEFEFTLTDYMGKKGMLLTEERGMDESPEEW